MHTKEVYQHLGIQEQLLLPINKWKDGVGKAINFSYFSPYDVVRQPVTALLKTLEEGKSKTTRCWIVLHLI